MASVLPRIHSYPVLASSSLDYLPEFRYKTSNTRNEEHDGNFITVGHEVSKGNLVAKLISEGKAAFACTLTSAHSAYREVFVEDRNGGLKCDQKLSLDSRKVLLPLLFQPAVVALREINKLYLSRTDGVHEIWWGEVVSFPKGSVLASAPFWRSQGMLSSILRVRKAEDLPEGCYEVSEVEEEGFYFLVEASDDLFKSLQSSGKSYRHRDSIYAAALSEGLGILHRKFKEENNWKNHHNLRSLDAEIKKRNIESWHEEGFSANRVAAAFHPHKIETDSTDD